MTTDTVSTQPLYFDASPDGPLFGWLHRAEHTTARVGLVVCGPFGREEICAHRSLRQLAKAAAKAGIPTLRFDYAGCGNSSGGDRDAARLEAWTRSVLAAKEELQRVTGVSHVVLLGVRLGAALATRAALQSDDVAGLVAVAPVVSGRAYVRELTALAGGSRASEESKAQAAAEGLFETAGFVLTSETLRDFEALDLQSLPKAPAPQVLIVQRDDLPGSNRWRSELERVGAAVDVAQGTGYAGMMDDPHHTRVPADMIDAIVRWLKQRQDEAPVLAAAVRPALAGTAVMRLPRNEGGAAIRETAVEIDAGTSRLFGVLSTPAGDARGGIQAGILMLNAGAIRNVGPNRMYVPLARQWAAQGYAVLRVDISGLGDSASRDGEPDNAVYAGPAVADVEAALNFLRERAGVGECHLLGLCSGAYHSFKAAVAGRVPVASAVVINPLTFFWKDGMSLDVELGEHDVTRIAASYKRSMLSPQRWLKLLRGQVDMRTLFQVVGRKAGLLLRNRARGAARLLRVPLKDDLYGELDAAARNGTRLHFVFSARDPGLELLRTHGGRMVERLSRQGKLSIDIIPDADHTFTTHGARQRLFAALHRLMGREIAAVRNAGEAAEASRREAAPRVAEPLPH